MIENNFTPIEKLKDVSQTILVTLNREPVVAAEMERIPGLFSEWLFLLRASRVGKDARRNAERLFRFCRASYAAHPKMTARELRRGMQIVLKAAKRKPTAPPQPQRPACWERTACRSEVPVGGARSPRGQCRRYTSYRGIRKRLFQDGQRRCYWCRRPFDGPQDATADHVVPLSRGGSNRLANIVLACHDCNARRKDASGPPQLVEPYFK